MNPDALSLFASIQLVFRRGIAAVFGVFALILKRLQLPIVPIILGMVLGGIMEVKLRSSMARIKTLLDFIDRPISAIIFTLIILVIGLHIRSYFSSRHENQGSA